MPAATGPASGPPARDRQIVRYTGAFVAIFIAAILLFTGYDQLRRRAAILEVSGRRAANLAHVLAEHLDRSSNAIEAALAQIARQWSQERANDEADWIGTLNTARAALPGVGSITIVDSEGVIRHSTLPHLVGQSRADTFIFRRMRDDASIGFLAEAPFRSQLNPKQMLIPLGARLPAPDGRFDGLVVATLIPDLLREFYQTVDVGPAGGIRILHPAGFVVFQQPSAIDPIGTPVASDPVLSAVRDGLISGRLRLVESDAAEARLVGFEIARASGLVVSVMFAESDLLSNWRDSLLVNAVITLFLVVALIAATLFLMRELATRRAVEQRLAQAQKMEAVGQLTGGIAHDFNNLLTVVLGCADQLRGLTPAGSETRRLTEMVVNAGERAARLTSQLLAFARRQVLRPERLDVNALINGMRDLLVRVLGADIDIEFATGERITPTLADPVQLETALLNLVINARDAMPEGGRLTIETADVVLDADYAAQERDVRPGPYVMVAVTDNGFGMAADIVARVFDPFFTTKENGKGTGLGLSMVYGFVKQSGGHIKLYSEVGHGTTVKLYLPPSHDPELAAPSVELTGEVRRGSETILVVEDDPMVGDLVTSQLRSLGYRVVPAQDGPTALVALTETPKVDLLFADVVLPRGMGGRQLAEEACRRRPGLRVLFTSGYTANSIVHNGRLDPGVRLLTKPYTRERLAHMIRQALDA